MSSRTATARKRLEQPHRINASKGLFSRSKSSSSTTPAPSNATTSPLLHDNASLPRSYIGVDLNTRAVSVNSGTLVSSSPAPTSPFPGGSGQRRHGNVDPPHFQPQTIPISTSAGPSFVEVSYQPPPPPVHKPGRSTRLPSSKANLDVHPAFWPPTYPPPEPAVAGKVFVPPAPNSDANPGRRTRQSVISEPPDYSPNNSPARPTLLISTDIPPSPHPSPRINPRRQGWLNSNSPQSHSPIDPTSDGEKRPWYRNALGKLSSSHLAAPTNTHAETGLRTPPSSNSNSHSAPSEASHEDEPPSNTTTNGAAPTFVFPGGRAAARPKMSAKAKSKLAEKRLKIDDSELVPRSPASDTSSLHRGLPNRSPLGSVIDLRASKSAPASSQSDQLQASLAIASIDRTRDEARSAFSDEGPGDAKPPNGNNAVEEMPKFVFPSSRSRAAPKKPLINSKRSRKASSATDDSHGERPKFMRKLIRKKKSDTSGSTSSISAPSGDAAYRPSSPGAGPSTQPLHALHGPIRPSQAAEAPDQLESQNRAVKIRSRLGNYPLDPYNSVLLDNDRHTGELLFRLNPTGTPSFHNYGNNPPSSVLDLGCGQGHWVVDAAIAWKGYGTKVVGYDIVDVSRTLLPWATQHGVADNIRFVRGNFLKQRLPFTNDSFDLVRMSCLALCVTSDSWVFVLQEVQRVLRVGGRLEFIDDDIFFPYAKAHGENGPSTPGHSFPPDLSAPQLDVTIPSASFSTFNVIDTDFNNPGLGSVDDLLDSRLYGLNEVDEDAESEYEDDEAETGRYTYNTHTRTNHNPSHREHKRHDPRAPHPQSHPSETPPHAGLDRQAWEESYATSRDLESLFDHMLVHKFGIQKGVSAFIFDLLKEVFGFAREMRTMHLTLAPCSTDPSLLSGSGGSGGGWDQGGEYMRGRQPFHGKMGGGDGVLSTSSVVAGPGGSGRYQTRGQVQVGHGNANANGSTSARPTHPRSSAIAHRKSMGLGRTPGLILWPSTFIPMEQHEIEIHASKHYRMLLSCKNLLMEHAVEATEDEQIDEDSVMEALWEYESFLRHRLTTPPPAATTEQPGDAKEFDDAASFKGSIAESVSSDLWEIQNEFRQRFAWDRSRSRDRRNLTPVRGGSSVSSPTTTTATVSPVEDRRGGRRHEAWPSTSSANPPVYSQTELTHVRTIRVYEAIKLDESLYADSV